MPLALRSRSASADRGDGQEHSPGRRKCGTFTARRTGAAPSWFGLSAPIDLFRSAQTLQMIKNGPTEQRAEQRPKCSLYSNRHSPAIPAALLSASQPTIQRAVVRWKNQLRGRSRFIGPLCKSRGHDPQITLQQPLIDQAKESIEVT
jgi:hypothetical protein